MEIEKYNKPVLVAGCQRSGGTMLASVLCKHPEITNPFWSADTELDAALLLSGAEKTRTPPTSKERFCFQTTYLNERYLEYFQHSGKFKLIWLIRNPHSVVFSMIHNWSRFALNEVFLSCGLQLAPVNVKKRYNRFGILAIKPVERACWSYLAKMEQCESLLNQLPSDAVTTVDYDDLVSSPKSLLPKLLEFSGLAENHDIGKEISTRSLSKADRLSYRNQQYVDKLCLESYATAKENWVQIGGK